MAEKLDEWIWCSSCGMWVDFNKSRIVDRNFKAACKDDFKKCIGLLELKEKFEVCDCEWVVVRPSTNVGASGSVEVDGR